jgi:Cu+-exporting ATPase
VLELRARSRTGAAIRALLDLAPKTARRIADGNEEDVPLEQITPGGKCVETEKGQALIDRGRRC